MWLQGQIVIEIGEKSWDIGNLWVFSKEWVATLDRQQEPHWKLKPLLWGKLPFGLYTTILSNLKVIRNIFKQADVKWNWNKAKPPKPLKRHRHWRKWPKGSSGPTAPARIMWGDERSNIEGWVTWITIRYYFLCLTWIIAKQKTWFYQPTGTVFFHMHARIQVIYAHMGL